MAEYTNAQKLAAVLTEWSRPAVSQVIANRLGSLSFVKQMQTGLINTGLVGVNYSMAKDVLPFFSNGIDNFLQPVLESYLSKMPDETIPAIAHSVCSTAMEQPKFSILDGLIEFDQDDIIELKDLLDKNLPLVVKESYPIIK